MRLMHVLLVPLAILAFIVFLLVLGAIGLAIATAVLTVFGQLWRLTFGRVRGRSG